MPKGIEIEGPVEQPQEVRLGIEEALALIDSWVMSGDYVSLIQNTPMLTQFYSPEAALNKQINGIRVKIAMLEEEKENDHREREEVGGLGFLRKPLEGTGVDLDDIDENNQIDFLRKLRQKLEEKRNSFTDLIQNGETGELPQE